MNNYRMVILGAILLAAAVGLKAQGPGSLETAFTVEARLLDEAVVEYGRARGQERSALAELSRLGQLVDATLADPNSALDDLTALETDLAVARERVCARSLETAQLRQRMYGRMERLATLARELQQRGELTGASERSIDGLWQLEAQPIDLYGLVNLRLEGAQVSGPYRLSNGRRGSVRGTLAGSRLELELVDSELGVVANVVAQADLATGRIEGTWQALELAAGRAATGRWTARRISSEAAADLEL